MYFPNLDIFSCMTVGMPSFFVRMRSGLALGCLYREYNHVEITCLVAIQPALHCSTSSLQNVSTCMSYWRYQSQVFGQTSGSKRC